MGYSARKVAIYALLIMLARNVQIGDAEFCSMTTSTKTCPSPPTIDSIQILNYLGDYYEIGSTARTKFRNEPGLVCNRVNYSLAITPSGRSGAVMNVLISGLQEVGSQTASAISQISAAASTVCSNAQQICSVLASTSRVNQALRQISTVASRIAAARAQEADILTQSVENIKQLLSTVQERIENLAGSVNAIQTANADFDQTAGTSSNSDQLGTLRAVVDQTISEAQAIGGILRGELSMERGNLLNTTVGLTRPDMQIITQAVSFIDADVQQMTTHYSRIESQLTQIQGPFASMIEADIAGRNGSSITSSTTGRAVQRARQPGGMDLTIGRSTSPYEIIALEGKAEDGYTAALVYSCIPATAGGGTTPVEDLFVLSRTPELPSETLDKFLKLATGYGISMTCDNPFINAIQRGGSCGAR